MLVSVARKLTALAAGATLCVAGVAGAQEPIGVPAYATFTSQYVLQLRWVFPTTTDWTAIITADAGSPSEDALDSNQPSRSRICFSVAAKSVSDCESFADLFRSKLAYQDLADIRTVPLNASGDAGLMLEATGFYPTGTVHETAIWDYDPSADRFNLAIALQSQELQIWSAGPYQGYLVTSDWVWTEHETRWEDHKRKISVYRYATAKSPGAYQLAFAYVTDGKYGAELTNTIDRERQDIDAKIDSLAHSAGH